MTDLNLDVDFFDHPKCARLSGLLGRDAEVFPLRLWAYAAKYHSVDGQLCAYPPGAVERIVRWRGTPNQCVDALVSVGFLDPIQGGYQIHDWKEHQGHIHALKVRNKKVAKNRWKNIKTDGSSVDTSGIPSDTSGIPRPTIPTVKEKPKERPPDKPPAVPMPKVQEPKPNGTTPPGDGSSTPKSSEYPPPKTDVQKVVMAFKLSMGVPKDDRDWDGVYFRRYSRAAGDLLTLFRKDVGRVADCIEAVSGALTRKGLSWTPETIVKHASDWKEGKLFK